MYTQNEDLQAQLFKAAKSGDLKALTDAIDKGADVNDSDKSGRGWNRFNTPLHYAVKIASLECVKKLLHAGAKVYFDNHEGETPLHIAARYRNSEYLEMMLNYAKSQLNSVEMFLNKTDSMRPPPIHIAAMYGSKDCLRILIQHGTKPDLKYGSCTLLKSTTVRKKGIGCMEALIEQLVEIDESEDVTCEMVQRLVRNNSPIDIIELLRSKSKLKIDGMLSNMLVTMAKEGCDESLELLIKLGVDVRQADNYVGTALHYAAQNGEDVCVEILLAAGADIVCYNSCNETPLHSAAEYPNPNCLELLIQTAEKNNIKHVVNTKFNDNHPAPIHSAVQAGNVKCINLLIKNGADLNSIWIDNNKKHLTPLQVAIYRKHIDCINELTKQHFVIVDDCVFQAAALKEKINNWLEECHYSLEEKQKIQQIFRSNVESSEPLFDAMQKETANGLTSYINKFGIKHHQETAISFLGAINQSKSMGELSETAKTHLKTFDNVPDVSVWQKLSNKLSSRQYEVLTLWKQPRSSCSSNSEYFQLIQGQDEKYKNMLN